MPNAGGKEIGKDVERRGVVEINLRNNYSSAGYGFPSGGIVETVENVGDSSSSPDSGSSDNYSPYTSDDSLGSPNLEIDSENDYSSAVYGSPSGGIVETVENVGDSSSSPDSGSSDNYSPYTSYDSLGSPNSSAMSNKNLPEKIEAKAFNQTISYSEACDHSDTSFPKKWRIVGPKSRYFVSVNRPSTSLPPAGPHTNTNHLLR